MELFNRLSDLFNGNINESKTQIDDPESILEQALIKMQQDSIKLRQAVDQAISSPKCIEQQDRKNLVDTETARQLMSVLEPQVEQQQVIIDLLQQNIAALEEFEKLIFELEDLT
jgi:hypothetical protein